MPDYGTARCDFPGGSSKLLFESIQKRPGQDSEVSFVFFVFSRMKEADRSFRSRKSLKHSSGMGLVSPASEMSVRIMQLPDETRVFVGHDYLPKDGRSDFAWETTIGEERRNNIHIGGGKSQVASVDLK